MTKLREQGLSAEEVEDAHSGLRLDVCPFMPAQATTTSGPPPRLQGLSLGDRTRLALAAETGAVPVAAAQAWAEVDTSVQVELAPQASRRYRDRRLFFMGLNTEG